MKLARSAGGAIAGGLAAGVWAAQQPLDKRVFDCDYDDVELLGKLVTRGREWPLVGLAIHVQNGAAFGVAYSQLRPFLPGPPIAGALVMALTENFASWPLGRVTDRFHPARDQLPRLAGNRRALLQATWRHVLFGLLLGALEALINDRSDDEPPAVPVSTNGHGNLEAAMSAA
ncbi:MAG: hypothetical protein NVSMB25_26100 [Thermoleophilaceae bacterium]